MLRLRRQRGKQHQLLPLQLLHLPVPPPDRKVQRTLPLPQRNVGRVGAEQSGDLSPAPVHHHLPHALSAYQHGVQILVQKGLKPSLPPAHIHRPQKLLQFSLPLGRRHPHPTGQPHQLPDGRIHQRHRLPDGPVKRKLSPTQGHIPLQCPKGMPLLPPGLHLKPLPPLLFLPHSSLLLKTFPPILSQAP